MKILFFLQLKLQIESCGWERLMRMEQLVRMAIVISNGSMEQMSPTLALDFSMMVEIPRNVFTWMEELES